MKKLKRAKLVILCSLIVTIVTGTMHTIMIKELNKKIHSVYGKDETSETYMDIDYREDATSSWKKKDFDWNGKKVDLTGTTIDGVLYNNTSDRVERWTVRIDIMGDCFINQAWNGEVEIHQFVGEKNEKVQKLNLQKYQLDQVDFTYYYDGDLLIPLKAGDYVIYYPNASFKEYPIEGNGQVKIGTIFYYLDTLDLTHYQLDFNYHSLFTKGIGFWVCLAGMLVLFASIVAYISMMRVLKEADRQLEMQKKGIACMSDIYEIIYMIKIDEDQLIPVHADENSELQRPKDLGAYEQLQNLFREDSEDAYRDFMCEFADLNTIADRLQDRNSIVCEYISKSYGWCQIRFFAMDRQEGESLKKVLFTIRRINEEKREIEEIRGRIEKAESENKAKSVFLANMSHEIRTPINAVLGFNTMILSECSDSKIKGYAREIKNAGTMLLALINTILDFSKLEAGKMELSPVEYSLRQTIYDVYGITKFRMEEKQLEFKLDVSEDTPDKLYGDDIRLKQIIINILTNAAKYTKEGEVKLTIKSQKSEGQVHLLVSVKDTGMGIKAEDMDKLTQRFARLDVKKNRNVEGTGIGLSLVCGLLEMMGSELKVNSIYGQGSEFYFEIVQKVIDPAPIGRIDLSDRGDVEDAEEPYHMPIRKDAVVLVVDDNPTNLLVIGKLLEKTQMEVVKANSGKQALEYTKERVFDMVFMDHLMPVMDGVECFEQIKKQKDGKNNATPVILLTANVFEEIKDIYQAAQFAGYLSKPVAPQQLEALIVDMIKSK